MSLFDTNDLYAALAKEDRTAEDLAAEFTKALNEASKRRSEELLKDKRDKEKMSEILSITEALSVFCEKYYSVKLSENDQKELAKELLHGFDLIAEAQECLTSKGQKYLNFYNDDMIIKDFLKAIM